MILGVDLFLVAGCMLFFDSLVGFVGGVYLVDLLGGWWVSLEWLVDG